MKHFSERPCAAVGLLSYRYPIGFGDFVMIGAKDDKDATRQAQRSLTHSSVDPAFLERWDGKQYVRIEGKR